MNQRGFVLVLTLWLLLIMALVAAAIATNTNQLISSAVIEKRQAESVWKQLAIRSQILHSMAMGRKSFHGLVLGEESVPLDDLGGVDMLPVGTELRLDDRIYRQGDLYFSVQDSAGLVGVNTLKAIELQRLIGAAAETVNIGQLHAEFWDYTDADELVRLNGAEAWDYQKNGRKLPLNRSLLHAAELKGLLSWPQDANVNWDNLRVEPLYWNINTAPREAIRIMTGLEGSAIDALITARETGFFSSGSQVNQFVGQVVLDPSGTELTFQPSDHLRLTTWIEGAAAWATEFELTPKSDHRPWEIKRIYPRRSREFEEHEISESPVKPPANTFR